MNALTENYDIDTHHQRCVSVSQEYLAPPTPTRTVYRSKAEERCIEFIQFMEDLCFSVIGCSKRIERKLRHSFVRQSVSQSIKHCLLQQEYKNAALKSRTA